MYGLNACYDSHPLTSGHADKGVSVSNKRTAFFQQLAFYAEAVSNSWNFNGYALVTVGETEQRLQRPIRVVSLIPTGLMLATSSLQS